MKKYIFIIILAVISSICSAQKELSQRDDIIQNKVLFLNLEGQNINFTDDGNYLEDEPLKINHRFSLKEDHINIYFVWLNPLRYQIIWKDTMLIDDRDKAVDDFIKLFLGRMGLPSSDIENQENSALFAKLPNPDFVKEKSTLYIPKEGYVDIDLINLYLHIRGNYKALSDVEIDQINAILENLDHLDNWNSTDFPAEVEKSFLNLYNIDEIKNAAAKVQTENTNLTGWNETLKKINEMIPIIKASNDKLEIKSDPVLPIYIKQMINNYLNKVSTNYSNSKILVSKYTPCINLIEKSITKELFSVTSNDGNTNNQKYYKYSRSISLEAGKVLETTVTVYENEFDEAKNEFVKKSTICTQHITFRAYDWVEPTFSTGIFYSDVAIKGFGISTNDNGELIISEDEIQKNSAVTGLFFNLNFNVGSRYFAPIIQLGLDPTKKRPYILAGGGFSIPYARISFTGGPIWTWEMSLKSLSVGQVVESTTELENDITYKTNISPKGWYIGIQYNFW